MENNFLNKFDLVKSKFKKNLKDNIFKKEIEVFTKYNILDENNMFNYIYIHNYYENLIENPIEYKINLISTNKEQIISFISKFFNEPDIKYDFDKNFKFQTYVTINEKNKEKKLYDLYFLKDKEKKIIITNKSFKEIISYLNDEKNKDELKINNKANEILITTSDYKFNSYPSIIFSFYFGDKYKTDIIPLIKNRLEEEYKDKNNDIILLEKDILNKYFSDKTTLYLSDQIYHRTTSLLSTLNIFFYCEEEWEQNKDLILNNINIEKKEKFKDILINNIICNFVKNKLYLIDKEKEADFFNSASSYDGENYFNIIEYIHKNIFTHFKGEMHFTKTLLLNYNSLINDHLKITYTKNDNLILNENILDNFKNNINALIKDAEEDYFQKRNQLFQDIIAIPKDTLLNNIANIKQEIHAKYIITNSTLNYVQTQMMNYLSNYKSQILLFNKEIDNQNINIFYSLKKILNEKGIYSLNFDGLIKIIAVERITVYDPIQNLLQHYQTSFSRILASFGISGIVGGAASFIAGRATTTIGASAATGTFGGPLGIGIGVVVGVGTLLAQARHHFKGNRGVINTLFEEMDKNINETINIVENSINKELEKIRESMEKDLKEIKNIIDIIIERAIKLMSE